MVFGDIATFAVEAELLRVVGTWAYGHLRFWIGGKALGDFDDTSDLAGSARWGRQFLAASPRRTHLQSGESDATTAYHELFGRFFQRGGSADGELFDRDPFVLDEVGESSLRDRVSILAVRRRDGRDRVIVREHHTESTWEELVPAGVCDEVIGEYCHWVEGQLPR